MNTLKIRTVTWYVSDDRDHSGDYVDIHLYVNGVFTAEFGDAYHNRGGDVWDGYLKALESLGFTLEQTSERKNCSKKTQMPRVPKVKKTLKEILA